MQRQYKAEFFDNEFSLVGHSAILSPAISMDYLTNNASTLECVNPIDGLKQYHLVNVTDESGGIVFQGIVYGFQQEKDALMQVTVKPLLALLDRTFTTDGYISVYKTVEGWMAHFLETNYAGNENVPESFKGFEVNKLTSTAITEDRDPEMAATMNMSDYAIEALQRYGVIIKAAFDPHGKTFTFDLERSEKETTVEADLKNVVSKTFNIDGDGERYNVARLFFVDSETEAKTERWFALNSDGSIVETTPPNYHLSNISPPLMVTYADIGSGYNTTDKVPDENVWEQKAREVLKPESDSQQIELAFSETDRVVRIGIEELGQKVKIRHDGSVYNARLTAVSVGNGVKNMTFGFARTDLTTILNFQRRGKTW